MTFTHSLQEVRFIAVRRGARTIAALLVAIALPRLRRAGILSEVTGELQADSELQLYRLLRLSPGDAYSQYNALLRRLAAFEQALDRRIQRQHPVSVNNPLISSLTPAPGPAQSVN